MKLWKIVITGGPCAGKTTALSWIENYFSQRGYRVLFVSETATELISGGLAPWTAGTNLDYQKCQVRLQLAKERIFEQGARTMDAEKILLICDRGALDNKAYMNDEEWQAVLKDVGSNEIDLRDNYDAVFHLVTAARGAEEAYTLSNNAARTETIEQARSLDDKLIAAWTGHPHMRIIDNSTEFEEKLERLMAEILSFLGEPDPFEIERKYLIEYPDLDWLEAQPNVSKVEIIQTYLNSPQNVQIRVRQRGMDGHYIYTRTEKRAVSETRRVEIEERLTQEEYLRQLMDADITAHPIRKTRYCLAEDNRYFELDIYPQWKRQAILEIELRNEEEEIRIPAGIKVIREVTGEKQYKNYELAHHMLEEEA